jgi:hypothetical protein
MVLRACVNRQGRARYLLRAQLAAAWLLHNVIADSVIQKVACGTHRLMYGATVPRHLRNTPDSRSVTVPLCLWRFHGISADPTHFEFGMCLFWYVMSGLRVSA